MNERWRPQGAFLDRDGTLIVDRHYARDPEQVTLLPGAAEALRLLAAHGIPAIVVTNQSGIARGQISLAQYSAVRRRLDALLAAEGVALHDSFACPHHPDVTGPCVCRKPGAGLFRRAAAQHGLRAERCLFVGDRWRDVAPALELGGRGALIVGEHTPAEDVAHAERLAVARVPSLLHAVRDALGEGA